MTNVLRTCGNSTAAPLRCAAGVGQGEEPNQLVQLIGSARRGGERGRVLIGPTHPALGPFSADLTAL